MKYIEKEVKSEGKVVGKVKIAQAGSWDECIKIAGKEEDAIAMFNAQHATNEMNKARKPTVDPTAKLVASAMKDPNVKQADKDKILAILKAAGLSIPAGAPASK